MDVEAERQLAELETKIALNGNPATNYTTTQVHQVQTVGGGAVNGANGTSAQDNDIESKLRELESRLGGQK